MKFKIRRCYRHESGAVGMIVGRMSSIIIGKSFVMEMFIRGQNPTLQPVGNQERHTKGWTLITKGEFVEALNDMNKERLEDKVTSVKADNCMRDIANREKNDLHLVVTLTCGHVVKFDKNDKEPKKGSKFKCRECSEQNKLVLEKLEATLAE